MCSPGKQRLCVVYAFLPADHAKREAVLTQEAVLAHVQC